MTNEFNFSQFEEFCENYKKSMQFFDSFLEKFLLEMAERLIDKTKPRTPVGTPESTGIPGYVGGSLRDAWKIGEIEKVEGALEVEILNGMDYATFVEYGHRVVGSGGVTLRWLEGRFMLTISMDEIHKQMPLRFEKSFKQWCLEMGLV